MSEESLAYHLIIRGRVQGVFFRASTRSMASSLGLTGWVRNVADGSVEIHAEGLPGPVDRFVAWCWKGPPGAVVTDVELAQVPVTGIFSSFQVRY